MYVYVYVHVHGYVCIRPDSQLDSIMHNPLMELKRARGPGRQEWPHAGLRMAHAMRRVGAMLAIDIARAMSRMVSLCPMGECPSTVERFSYAPAAHGLMVVAHCGGAAFAL